MRPKLTKIRGQLLFEVGDPYYFSRWSMSAVYMPPPGEERSTKSDIRILAHIIAIDPYKAVAGLPPRSALVLLELRGVGGVKKTHRELGLEFKISRERVIQIERACARRAAYKIHEIVKAMPEYKDNMVRIATCLMEDNYGDA